MSRSIRAMVFLVAAVLAANPAWAVPADVTSPSDFIFGSGLTTSAPVNEGPRNTIDNNVNTKYLNFNELNTGITVTPLTGLSVVTSIALTSANDAPERDPASYQVFGSTDGINFTLISSGTVPAFSNRFVRQEIPFANGTEYSTYRVVFPTVANSTLANSMQVGEIELVGEITGSYIKKEVNLSSIFNGDAVTNLNGGVLDTVHNGVDPAGRTFYTQAAALFVSPALGTGLPDSGVINHPVLGNVPLAYSNTDDGNNTVRLAVGQTAALNFSGPDQTKYAGFYLYATAGEGNGNLVATFTYDDGSTGTATVIVPDWFNDDGQLPQGAFALINGLDRAEGPIFNNSNDPAIFAVPLLADVTKTLTSITFTNVLGGNVNNVISIFGATSFGLAAEVPEPGTALLGAVGLAGLLLRRRRVA